MSTVTQNLTLSTVQSVTPAGLPGTVTPLTFNQAFAFNPTSGTAANQVNLVYLATLAFSAAPIVLNLKSLLDPAGGAVAFARVRSLWLSFRDTTDGHVLLLGYATTTANAWTALVSNPGQVTLQAATAANAGVLLVTAPNATGWAVGTSNRLLQLDPGASSFSVDIAITGCDA